MFPGRTSSIILHRGYSLAALGSGNAFFPSRGAHGGAQGDGVKHKHGQKDKVKYFDIPRIPGVTCTPDDGGPDAGDSEKLSPGQQQRPPGLIAPHAALDMPTAVVNPEFFNRNPRNLEMMNLAVRRTGWGLEAGRKDFHNKILFERTPFHTRASVLHASGRTVVSASTEEFAIAKFLYRTTDISAAKNIGRVLARRMLETGIVAALCDFGEEERKGNRVAVFLESLTESGIQLEEGARIKTPNPYGSLESRRLK
ncbi:putative 39S ribosomal protein L18, mitochondrial [Hypsibius exemplaris]|uniref:Large ribosomal subunit protein uL18m n=1 Tax=Hypsibius exemplaris TaxID=2072580 RepID=A0A1W0WAJ0_HYPEX|nr:putative 39S ribosomal protein L18, mitochondrial [Hypsibius exemplaris]